MISVFCDGGARGNPGPAGIGFVVFDENQKVLVRAAKFLGRATNNVAEYQAVIESLKWFTSKKDLIGQNKDVRIKFHLDSMLVVNQLNGLFKIKNAALRNLIIQVRQLENAVSYQITYHHIPREKNKIADDLVNQIINKKISSTSKKDRNSG
jgi:ribonuclease HI